MHILSHMTNHSTALDRVFHALADPTRRAIVARLCRGPASVSELAKPLSMALPTVLQHLQVLEQSRLIRSEKAGRVRTCHLDPVAFATIEAADHLGLPVSTTHILSSGIAGTMVANGSGIQKETVRNIVLAWVLTLPVCVLLGAALFGAALFFVLRVIGVH